MIVKLSLQYMDLNGLEFNAVLQEWMVIFARRSIHDFLNFAHQYHLSMAQINLLMRLHYRGPATIAALRQDFYGSRAAASQMIDELVKAGWVARVEAENDRRLKVVSLTPAGRELVEKGIEARRRWLVKMAGSFSEAQKEQIAEVLWTMVQAARNLEEAGESSTPPAVDEE